MRLPVLLFGGTDSDHTWLQSCLGQGYLLLAAGHQPDANAHSDANTPSDANGRLAGQRPAPAIVCESSTPALRALAARCELPLLLLSAAPRAEAADEIWYVLGRWLPSEVVRSLIESASRAGSVPAADLTLAAARHPSRLAESLLAEPLLAESLLLLAGQRDLPSAERACVAVVSGLVVVSRAECRFFDPESGALWSEAGEAELGTERRAVGGLVGYAARTGTRVNVPAVAADARWIEALDGGQPGERLLVIPIVGRLHQVHAVLVAWRAAPQSPFAAEDEASLAAFAERAAPLFDQLSLELEAIELARGQSGPGLFRAEALEARLPQHYGALLRVPRWSTWPYFALAGLLGCAAGLVWVSRADLYPARNDTEAGCTHDGYRSISQFVCEWTGRGCRGKGSDDELCLK